MSGSHAADPFDADFASFLDEVAREVEAHVDAWRVRLGEAVARWQAEGVATEVLERAIALPAEPDVDGLLATFDAAVARLRAMEADAAAHDPSLAGHAAFRDPARLAEAQSLLQQAYRVRAAATPSRARPVERSAIAAAQAAAVPVLELDPETFVVEWPDVGALLVEEFR